MRLLKTAGIVVLAVAAAACGQGGSENVMSPEGNALAPADVNAALGPEVTNTQELNFANEEPSTGNDVDNETNEAFPPDEPTPNGATQ